MRTPTVHRSPVVSCMVEMKQLLCFSISCSIHIRVLDVQALQYIETDSTANGSGCNKNKILAQRWNRKRKISETLDEQR